MHVFLPISDSVHKWKIKPSDNGRFITFVHFPQVTCTKREASPDSHHSQLTRREDSIVFHQWRWKAVLGYQTKNIPAATRGPQQYTISEEWAWAWPPDGHQGAGAQANACLA